MVRFLATTSRCRFGGLPGFWFLCGLIDFGSRIDSLIQIVEETLVVATAAAAAVAAVSLRVGIVSGVLPFRIHAGSEVGVVCVPEAHLLFFVGLVLRAFLA